MNGRVGNGRACKRRPYTIGNRLMKGVQAVRVNLLQRHDVHSCNCYSGIPTFRHSDLFRCSHDSGLVFSSGNGEDGLLKVPR